MTSENRETSMGLHNFQEQVKKKKKKLESIVAMLFVGYFGWV